MVKNLSLFYIFDVSEHATFVAEQYMFSLGMKKGSGMVRLATCRRDPLLFNYYCTRVRGIFYCSLSFLAGENQVFVMVHSGLDSH